MKHGESDVERQISIQGIYLSVFWNYFWNTEGNFNCSNINTIFRFNVKYIIRISQLIGHSYILAMKLTMVLSLEVSQL